MAKDTDKVICTVCGQHGEFWKDETPRNKGGQYCGKDCARAGAIVHAIQVVGVELFDGMSGISNRL